MQRKISIEQQTETTLKAKIMILALAATCAAVPAQAHGLWFNFGIGLPFYPPPPVYYAPPSVVYAPPAPLVLPAPDPVVRWAQLALNALGYGPLDVDGIAGPATVSAIYGFPRVNYWRLNSDGVLGNNTISAIADSLRHAGLAYMAAPPPSVVPAAAAPPPPPPPAAPHDDKSPAPAPTQT